MKSVYYLQQTKNQKNLRVEEGQEITIGRSFENTLMLDDSSVSRFHAVIKWKKGLMYITDLQSTNGTFVNGEKVEQNFYVELNFSDEILIGKVPLKVLDEDAVASKKLSGENQPAKTIILDAEQTQKLLNNKKN